VCTFLTEFLHVRVTPFLFLDFDEKVSDQPIFVHFLKIRPMLGRLSVNAIADSLSRVDRVDVESTSWYIQ
jgi:hypothetical protein